MKMFSVLHSYYTYEFFTFYSFDFILTDTEDCLLLSKHFRSCACKLTFVACSTSLASKVITRMGMHICTYICTYSYMYVNMFNNIIENTAIDLED